MSFSSTKPGVKSVCQQRDPAGAVYAVLWHQGRRWGGDPSHFTVNQTHGDENHVWVPRGAETEQEERGQKACSTFPATHSLPVCGSVAQRGRIELTCAYTHTILIIIYKAAAHMMTNGSHAHFPSDTTCWKYLHNLHVPATADFWFLFFSFFLV